MTLHEVTSALGEPDLFEENENEEQEYGEGFTTSTVRVCYGPFGAYDTKVGDVTRYRLELTFSSQMASSDQMKRHLDYETANPVSADEQEKRDIFNQHFLFGTPALKSWARNEPVDSDRRR